MIYWLEKKPELLFVTNLLFLNTNPSVVYSPKKKNVDSIIQLVHVLDEEAMSNEYQVAQVSCLMSEGCQTRHFEKLPIK